MKLLIVDDSTITAESLARYFEMAGHEAAHVETGDGALEALSSGVFDAVVLDQRLPNCYGLDVLREMRRVGCLLPVVMATAVDAVAADGLRRELVYLNPAALVRKPYSPRELLDAIGAMAAGGGAK